MGVVLARVSIFSLVSCLTKPKLVRSCPRSDVIDSRRSAGEWLRRFWSSTFAPLASERR